MNRAVLLALAALLCSAVIADDDGLVSPTPRSFDSTGEAMQFGLGRGIVNLFTCWLEVPRCFSFEFTARPLAAVFTAPFMGATFTAMRAVFGTGDLLTCGYTGYFDYATGMPDYPWDQPWVSTTTDIE